MCKNKTIMSNTLENIYINAYNALYYKNLRIIFVFVQNNIEFDRSVCALFCDFHRYRGYHIRDQRESTRLRQANTNTLNHDSYQKKNVTSQSTQNCRWNHFTSQTMTFICGIMLPLKQWLLSVELCYLSNHDSYQWNHVTSEIKTTICGIIRRHVFIIITYKRYIITIWRVWRY
jgi:hypothetical protein